MSTPPPPGTEGLIVRSAARGDAVAWQQLLDANHAQIACYVRWRCAGIADLTADVLQQTWMEAARHLRKFDPGRGSFADWVGGIARNVILAELRKRRRDRSRVQSLSAVPEPGGEAVAVADSAEEVAETLTQLPPEYEDVLRAKYLEGLSMQQIAESKSETIKAVESRLTRAREAFRKLFQQRAGNS